MSRGAVIGFVVALAGSAVLGLAGGLAWGELAPRVLLQEVAAGTAQVVNPETRAFIGADAWFCLIGAVAGLLSGVIGYRAGIARRAATTRAAVTAGLIGGAVAGGFVMLWLGQRIGLPAYHHQLAGAAVGATFSASLGLGAKSALAFWPLLTALVIVLAEVSGRQQQPDSDHESAPVPAPYPGPEPGSFPAQ